MFYLYYSKRLSSLVEKNGEVNSAGALGRCVWKCDRELYYGVSL